MQLSFVTCLRCQFYVGSRSYKYGGRLRCVYSANMKLLVFFAFATVVTLLVVEAVPAEPTDSLLAQPQHVPRLGRCTPLQCAMRCGNECFARSNCFAPCQRKCEMEPNGC
ncbi:uncharacterized protein LOC117643313 [Thrips palmi]|uniref:Uncharacterized protein LOC117643313 n=1 Tax=Thrips palmi TaxID=161013 RepID=A0A6P8YLQ1_THRPL|nr:uncharacterized protein LOC117643313 [Thrips palmi]